MDANNLVSAIKPEFVICGAEMLGLPTAGAALEYFRQRVQTLLGLSAVGHSLRREASAVFLLRD